MTNLEKATCRSKWHDDFDVPSNGFGYWIFSTTNDVVGMFYNEIVDVVYIRIKHKISRLLYAIPEANMCPCNFSMLVHLKRLVPFLNF